MSKRIQLRRDSTYNWENLNPVLADGEPGLEYETNKIKIGDGETNWTGLPYSPSVPSLATVATSGEYNDLNGRPYIPTSFMDFVSSYSAANNRQFLRFNSSDSSIGFSSDFRVVPYSSVVYPGGTFGSDKVGDVAFNRNGIYYCFQEPNSYIVHNNSGQGYNPVGWIRIDNMYGKPDSLRPVVGTKLTDGVYTSTVAEIVAGWGAYGMVVRVDPVIQSWHDTASDLTVFTGDAPNTGPSWARIGTEVAAAPAHNNSNGIAGQIAFDSNYIYRCTQTNVSQISATYHTPKYTDAGYINQGSLTDIRINNDGVVPTPQNGWIISDGTNTRTITNVNPNSGQSGSIWILSYTGDMDWSSVTSLTIISQQAADAVWKRTALSADTW